MKIFKLLLALISAGIVSSSAFASENASATCAQSKLEKPSVTEVVEVTGLPYRYKGETVHVAFTVDQTGQPSDIKIISRIDSKVEKSVRTALAQWRFSPAKKDGQPVLSHVMLPIELM